MTTSHTSARESTGAPARLRDTQDAFDSVAADYDGDRGNNALIQDMRSEMWRWLDSTFASGSRLIDLGCGTGLDAVRMARLGHNITATDWSPRMVERTRARIRQEQLTSHAQALTLGAHELERLDGMASYDGAYSNLGPLNCVPDLGALSRQCARLLKSDGALVFTVIGRICPWELAHYLRQRRWSRATVRYARGFVPVNLNGHAVWTHYYGPREFYRSFREHFVLTHFRGLCVFAPPPYLTWLRERHLKMHAMLWSLDRRLSGWPLFRHMGDHFLIVMRKR